MPHYLAEQEALGGRPEGVENVQMAKMIKYILILIHFAQGRLVRFKFPSQLTDDKA